MQAHRNRTLLIGLFAALLSGCGGDGTAPYSCALHDRFIPSLNDIVLTYVDSQDKPVIDVSASFSRDGLASVSATCNAGSNVCRIENPFSGQYKLTSKKVGYADSEISFKDPSGLCEYGQRITVRMLKI
jgi:hypothetical protein